MQTVIHDLRDMMDPFGCIQELQQIASREEPLQISNIEISQALAAWHRILFDMFDLFLDNTAFHNKKVLCGFNAVNDMIYYIASRSAFERLLQVWGNPVPTSAATSEPIKSEEALACLIEMMKNPQREGKYYPKTHTLLEKIHQGAKNAGLSSSQFLGGAAGNTAYVLGHLGVRTVVHCPYHADQLNWGELTPQVSYLEFGQRKPKEIPANPPKPNLPCKTTVGFQILPGWDYPQLNLNVTHPARALFISRNPVAATRYWQQVNIRYKHNKVSWPDSNGNKTWNDPNPWPHPQAFTYMKPQRTNPLEVVPANSSTVKKLRDYTVAILGGIGYSYRRGSQGKFLGILDNVRKDQLDALYQINTPIHAEISDKFNLTFLNYLIGKSHSQSSSKWSLSLNQDDIVKLTSETNAQVYESFTVVDPYLSPTSGRMSLFDRFIRAKHLLNILDADWIYAHGNELDIAVWKPKACSSNIGEKLRDGMLLAKGAVIAAMIRRLVPPPLMTLVNAQLKGSSLAGKGFWSLAQFAVDFSKWAHPICGMPERTIRDNLLFKDGFYECGDDFGVAVAPVFWPGVAQYLSATGAGDYSSAVVAAYVW